MYFTSPLFTYMRTHRVPGLYHQRCIIDDPITVFSLVLRKGHTVYHGCGLHDGRQAGRGRVGCR